MANWQIKIDLSSAFKQNDKDDDFKKLIKNVLLKLKKAMFAVKKLDKKYKDTIYGSSLEDQLDEIIMNIEGAENASEFNDYLTELYDWADQEVGTSESFAGTKRVAWIGAQH